jgi:hypothetical protein
MPSAAPSQNRTYPRSVRTRSAGRKSRPIVLVRRRMRSDAEAGVRLRETQAPPDDVPYAQRYYGERV